MAQRIVQHVQIIVSCLVVAWYCNPFTRLSHRVIPGSERGASHSQSSHPFGIAPHLYADSTPHRDARANRNSRTDSSPADPPTHRNAGTNAPSRDAPTASHRHLYPSYERADTGAYRNQGV
jgi:hypothetical protein